MTLQRCIYIFLAIGVSMFLVFAVLCASVDSTYPGFNAKYKPGAPLYQGGLRFPNDTFWNGLVSSSDSALNMRLMEVAKLGPTIFPILFAGILGGTLRLIARRRAEIGAKLETLEILIGSTSLASTVSTIFGLRAGGLKEIGLVLLWIISPLAGQASLRILGLQNATDATISLSWVALNTTVVLPIEDFDLLGTKFNYISALVNSQPALWDTSFVTLPLIARNESWELPPNLTPPPWAPSSAQSDQMPASLVGIEVFGPVVPVPQLAPPYHEPTFMFLKDGDWRVSFNSTMDFTVSYFDFEYPSFSEYSINGSWASILGPDFIYANGSLLEKQAHLGTGFFLDTNATFASQSTDPVPQSVLFGSFFNSKITLWSCFIYQSIRNVTVGCQDYLLGTNQYSCYLKSVGVSTISTATPFSYYATAASIMGSWPVIDPSSPGSSSLTEQFLANNYTNGLGFPIGFEDAPRLVDLSAIDNYTFATRLTTIFNTYIQASLNAASGTVLAHQKYWLMSTSATPLSFLAFQILKCNWIFFSILVLSWIFLIICCSVSIWLSYQISTPDILGYVSSLTIDTPYAPIQGVYPGSGSALDGLARAKILRDMAVQIRDVEQEDSVGKFALTNNIEAFQKTEKNRKYI